MKPLDNLLGLCNTISKMEKTQEIYKMVNELQENIEMN